MQNERSGSWSTEAATAYDQALDILTATSFSRSETDEDGTFYENGTSVFTHAHDLVFESEYSAGGSYGGEGDGTSSWSTGTESTADETATYNGTAAWGWVGGGLTFSANGASGGRVTESPGPSHKRARHDATSLEAADGS